jgi:hypothetical protein
MSAGGFVPVPVYFLRRVRRCELRDKQRCSNMRDNPTEGRVMDRLHKHLKLALGLASFVTLGANCSTPDYVGSRDCAELVKELDVPWFAETCERCQGKACEDGDCKQSFPCVDGKFVVQGCDDDSDCSDVMALCASHIARPHHVCTVADAI